MAAATPRFVQQPLAVLLGGPFAPLRSFAVTPAVCALLRRPGRVPVRCIEGPLGPAMIAAESVVRDG